MAGGALVVSDYPRIGTFYCLAANSWQALRAVFGQQRYRLLAHLAAYVAAGSRCPADLSDVSAVQAAGHFGCVNNYLCGRQHCHCGVVNV